MPMTLLLRVGWLALVALLATGCNLKNTWDYETTTAKAVDISAPPTLAEARRACKTPLRVAVGTESRDLRSAGDYGVAGSMGWALGGLVMSLPLGIVKEEPLSYEQMSWTEMYEIALYAELVDSGCFATVAWRPKSSESFDLVIDPTLRRFGNQKQFPGPIPLPIFIGTAFSLGFADVTFLNEWDVVAKRPDGVVVFEYGAEAACEGTDCISLEDASASSDLREQLRRGYVGFVDQLYGYLSSRTPAYWEEVRARNRARYFHAVDVGLGRLEKAAAGGDAAAATEVERRSSVLDAIWKIEIATEDAYALGSKGRVEAIVLEANRRAEAEWEAKMKQAVVMSAAGAVTLGTQLSNGGQVQPTFMLDVQKKTEAFSKDLERIEKWVDLARSVVEADRRQAGDPVLRLLDVLQSEKGNPLERMEVVRKRYGEIVAAAGATP